MHEWRGCEAGTDQKPGDRTKAILVALVPVVLASDTGFEEVAVSQLGRSTEAIP